MYIFSRQLFAKLFQQIYFLQKLSRNKLMWTSAKVVRKKKKFPLMSEINWSISMRLFLGYGMLANLFKNDFFTNYF
jgi:hypothetical protein